jgi:hypothetical protein
MYIFELITKIIKNKKNQNNICVNFEQNDADYTEKCEHTFFPIDSTGEILSCSKCGYIINKTSLKIKNNNPFN